MMALFLNKYYVPPPSLVCCVITSFTQWPFTTIHVLCSLTKQPAVHSDYLPQPNKALHIKAKYQQLEGMAHYTGLLLALEEGFGLQLSVFVLPLGEGLLDKGT